MNHDSIPVARTVDYLVIGSGIAGLTYALEAAKHGPTLILTKKSRAESNTNYAQGGVAGVMSDDDSFALHKQDTLVAGAGLCHEDSVEVLVREGPSRIEDLIRLGAKFDSVAGTQGHYVPQLGREGGHSRNRIVHSADRTGWEIERALLEATRNSPNLNIIEHYFVLDLVIEERDGRRRCTGALALDPADGSVRRFIASAVLLATGGCGQVYRHTTNPQIATGDGVAMSWRAGAAIANMEFIQFHPTALYHPEGRSFLISEAVRGEGGILRTKDGRPFMKAYHELGDLAPRDIVARAIHAERIKRGEPCVYLDVTHLEAGFLRRRFPTIYERCLELGIDIAKTPIPVVPAAHYACGGVLTDLTGRTGVDGLWACGEVACTGVHGANRLASNSLLEAMVFGRRAARDAVESNLEPAQLPEINQPACLTSTNRMDSSKVRPAMSGQARESVSALRIRLQSFMNDRVGIVRNDQDLEAARDELSAVDAATDQMRLEFAPDPELCELKNLSTVAGIIIRSALSRKESRGLHFTTDYPATDDEHWKHDTVLKYEG